MSTRRSADGWSRLLVPALVALALAAPVVGHAQADLDEQARALAAQLRCPVCQNLSVADSSSELARDMRSVIRAELAAGRTPEEIKAYFVSKYGDWILLSPRPRGLTWLLWLGPFAGAALGGLAVVRAARRWARRARSREHPPVDPGLVERVRREVGGDEAAPLGGQTPLELERDGLYAALRELDFDHRSGKLSGADFAAMRDDYEVRAAAVLAELAQGRAGAAAPAAPASRSEPSGPRRHPWRLVAASVGLLVFGVAVGFFLSQSIRPRTGDRQSITGDALTGTTPAVAMAREPGALVEAGRTAYERQDWPAAIDAFKQALALEPDNPAAHTFLGLILHQGGHPEEALRTVDRALTKAPTYPMALWAKGIVLFEGRRDYAGAIRVWERLQALDLTAEEADRVAAAIAEARQRLASPPAERRSAPRPTRASSRP